MPAVNVFAQGGINTVLAARANNGGQYSVNQKQPYALSQALSGINPSGHKNGLMPSVNSRRHLKGAFSPKASSPLIKSAMGNSASGASHCDVNAGKCIIKDYD